MNEMIKKLQPLLQAQAELQRKRSSGLRLISAIADYFGHTDEPMYSQIISERVEIDKSLKLLAIQIQSIQNACDHEFFYTGHDGDYSYHVCRNCNQTDKL